MALVIGSTAQAQPEEPGAAARAALAQLQQATESLDAADGARDRVRALTATIQAFESGLAAMREGVRRATSREAQLTRHMQAREAEIAGLVGALLTVETAPPPVMLLHPDGPVGSARAAMILGDLTPVLQARADGVRADLTEIRTLRALQESSVATLEQGLSDVQQARAELSMAIANRTDLPRRFTEDPVRTAILVSSSESLAAFADGLSEMSDTPIPPDDSDVSDLKGRIDLPVQGVVLRRAGEADAAGIAREGLILATRPRAIVTTPVAATIRYRGPLLDLGNVVILEPQADTLFVLSGMGEVFGEAGQVIPAGTAVGLMGGEAPEIGAFLSLSGDGTGTDRSETLYMEVRESGRPVDPETWFRTDKDG
ncbi:peptidase M23 [Sedimentitalea sp. CAU 1593]|uniref:Peptidase M23 n=2 Tax=Sedimentitalea arenosa TaxID=2798803 RepID=A0A8J7J949_9RHOB|nr:peptidase M23 [Arenibacterium arenosum]MBJ6373625.1 peptidase M23 [Arenibacterium arenosum]